MVVDLAILETMTISRFNPKLPEIAESEQTPLVRMGLPAIATTHSGFSRPAIPEDCDHSFRI